MDGDDELSWERLGAQKMTEAARALESFGIQGRITSVSLCSDGRWSMTIEGR